MIKKTVKEINDKIQKGRAVILTAEEVSELSKSNTPSEIIKKVDVVTTATFGPMCSSGAFINFGHSDPPIRMQNVTLNNVEAYAGLAAVDSYIGATQVSASNPKYGGAHVIEDLINGKDIALKATSPGTDCYPRKEIKTTINKNNVNEIFLFNPRNSYQNYPVATNSADKLINTYMGNLLPHFGNATYSTSGELSPLLNDPDMKTIGIGTRIFLGGTEGYVSWYGTQFHTSKPKNKAGIPLSNGATLAVIGNLKEMSGEYIKAAYFENYGVSIFIGIGIPIPIISEEIARAVSIRNENIETTICDYSIPDHPQIGITNYRELQSGKIIIKGREVRTASMSSLFKARQIADELKRRLKENKFLLTEPVQMFPQNTSLNSLDIRGEK